MIDRDIEEWADQFWHLAGRTEPFPRTLEYALAWALPVAVVRLPRLGFVELRAWLARMNIPFTCGTRDHRLRACLFARAGRGVIFLDGSDSDDEMRLSLAHEVAHFLRDYLEPRERVLAALGKSLREVLDGDRPPTKEERLGGVLKGMELGLFTHLMNRSSTGIIESFEVLEAEDRADRFALELLAPRSAVLAQLENQGVRLRDASALPAIRQALIDFFGLPASVAERYGRLLVIRHRPDLTVREWLGA